MKNLKEETLKELKDHNKTAEDIEFVTDGKKWISFNGFLHLSDFLYDNGYGRENINLELKVVGKDFWLERDEYDGAEGWEYKTQPSKPEFQSSNIKIKNF